MYVFKCQLLRRRMAQQTNNSSTYSIHGVTPPLTETLPSSPQGQDSGGLGAGGASAEEPANRYSDKGMPAQIMTEGERRWRQLTAEFGAPGEAAAEDRESRPRLVLNEQPAVPVRLGRSSSSRSRAYSALPLPLARSNSKRGRLGAGRREPVTAISDRIPSTSSSASNRTAGMGPALMTNLPALVGGSRRNLC